MTVFCVHLVIDQPPDRGKWCGLSEQAAWTVHHVKNHTLLGHSPPASQAGRRVGPALYSLAFGLIVREAEPQHVVLVHHGPSAFRIRILIAEVLLDPNPEPTAVKLTKFNE
jgi:hypothetical protein